MWLFWLTKRWIVILDRLFYYLYYITCTYVLSKVHWFANSWWFVILLAWTFKYYFWLINHQPCEKYSDIMYISRLSTTMKLPWNQVDRASSGMDWMIDRNFLNITQVNQVQCPPKVLGQFIKLTKSGYHQKTTRFQQKLSFRQYGSKTGPTFRGAWSRSILFEKVI